MVSVTYNSYSFSTTGRPAFSRSVAFDPPAADAAAQRAIVTWSVKQEWAEQTFADNQARHKALLDALRTPEGVLVIIDENGHTIFNERVRVSGHDLPEQWGQYLLEATVQFRAIRTDLLGDPSNATFTPTGGSAIVLPCVRSYRDGIRTERPSTNTDYRRETMVTISMSGAFSADATLDAAGRRDALLARKAVIEGIRDCANGTLAFGTDSFLVRIDQVDADCGDGSERLEWSLAASYRAFPDGSNVQAEYDVDEKQGLEKSELLLAVSGRVMAKTRAAAEQRAEEIKAQYATGRVLLDSSIKVALLDGADAEDGWLALNFIFSYRESLAVVSWELSVGDRDDVKTCGLLTTYAGRVTALTAAAALAKARLLGDGKWPLRLTANETVSTKSVADSAEIFLECAFSYEYSRKGAKLFAEVSGETAAETFGVSGETISGYVVAPTQGAAETAAATFKLSGRLLRSERMVPQALHQLTDAVDQFVRVNFSFSYFLGKSAGSLSYTVEDAKDYDARTRTMTYAGTAWAANDGACDTLINALIAAETGAILRDVRTPATEQAQSLTAFLSKNFNISFSRPLTAAAGEDILDAEYTVSITYSVGIAVFTNIPGTTPYVEEDVYDSPANIGISGQVTAITEASARAWARARRSGAIGGWKEDPPREDMNYRYAKRSGVTVALFRCSFQYGGRKASLVLS